MELGACEPPGQPFGHIKLSSPFWSGIGGYTLLKAATVTLAKNDNGLKPLENTSKRTLVRWKHGKIVWPEFEIFLFCPGNLRLPAFCGVLCWVSCSVQCIFKLSSLFDRSWNGKAFLFKGFPESNLWDRYYKKVSGWFESVPAWNLTNINDALLSITWIPCRLSVRFRHFYRLQPCWLTIIIISLVLCNYATLERFVYFKQRQAVIAQSWTDCNSH